MALGQEYTPLDELTKLPLLCVPHEDTALVLEGLRPNGGLFDWDHSFHPRLDPLLTGTLGGQAVRHSRIQLLHRREQHEPKHAAFSGPELPTDPEFQFQAVVLSAAGYVPRQALDFSTGQPRIVPLKGWQRQRLLTSGEVRVESTQTLREFLRAFVLSQEVEDPRPGLVDEFLDLVPNTTSAENRKQELAEIFLGMLIDPPAARMDELYRACFCRGSLSPDLPATPRAFIGREVVGYGRRSWSRLITALEMKLRARREGRLRAATERPSPLNMPKMRPVGRIALMPWGSNLSTGSALA